MKKLDWYILRKFIGTFVYSLGILLVISVVIDITEKVDDFMKHNLSFWQVVTEYYIGFVPHIAALLFPLFIFISVIFFTSKLAYKSEIIAILASGVSFKRFMRPYWVGAILFGTILYVANLWVIPRANRIRTTFENKYVGRQKDLNGINDKTLRIDTVTYVTFRYYDPNFKTGSNFTLQRVRNNQVYYKLKAESVAWDSTKKSWKLSYASERTINGLNEKLTRLQDTMLKIPLSPTEMVEEKNMQEAMTTSELNAYIKREELRGAEGLNVYYVEKYRRLSAGVAVVVLSLIGVIMSSRKVRGGSGLHMAVGIVISASYILFLQFSTVFSTKANLNPLLAVWIPNFVFGVLALYLYRRAPK